MVLVLVVLVSVVVWGHAIDHGVVMFWMMVLMSNVRADAKALRQLIDRE